MCQIEYILAKGSNKGKKVEVGETIYGTLSFLDTLICTVPVKLTQETINSLIEDGVIEVQSKVKDTYKGVSVYRDEDLEYEPDQETINSNIGKKLPIFLDYIYRMLSEYYIVDKRATNSIGNLKTMIQLLYKMNPASARIFAFYAAARILDRQYENHIRDAKDLYFIDDSNNKIYHAQPGLEEYDRSKTSFQNVPWFRTISDAVIAKKMWEAIEKDLSENNYIS